MIYGLIDRGQLVQVTLDGSVFAPLFASVVEANKFVAKYKLFHCSIQEVKVK